MTTGSALLRAQGACVLHFGGPTRRDCAQALRAAVAEQVPCAPEHVYLVFEQAQVHDSQTVRWLAERAGDAEVRVHAVINETPPPTGPFPWHWMGPIAVNGGRIIEIAPDGTAAGGQRPFAAAVAPPCPLVALQAPASLGGAGTVVDITLRDPAAATDPTAPRGTRSIDLHTFLHYCRGSEDGEVPRPSLVSLVQSWPSSLESLPEPEVSVVDAAGRETPVHTAPAAAGGGTAGMGPARFEGVPRLVRRGPVVVRLRYPDALQPGVVYGLVVLGAPFLTTALGEADADEASDSAISFADAGTWFFRSSGPLRAPVPLDDGRTIT